MSSELDVSQSQHLFQSPAEPFKHSLHVSSFLHGNDPRVILLIDPDQEVLLVVVPGRSKTAETIKSSEEIFVCLSLD